ncbi:serine/threonine protein kinase TNNI3K, putative [Entamoeba dispar SAW760]|uniref:Serine/threonine protein kinase TNNI3K, putative n=1 Tax=Entamoeba dispar (strain ATCC PRA-260 / SAW760) TaxID=370354 RepID=B0EQK3_ENTDS|nr:serine/threonine protein kinase TNNI3K, putative [Entamoeba dispar SAW760]EDR23202.1 serine/threonine protein kinase TNNI3K, putative [Entamoeba dispar SAW760]|eukprot:EDR23202.1 serine/threonine protein kinase TNNI3K, putative [Entamoeba dispar SAW760]
MTSPSSGETILRKIRIELTKAMNLFSVNNTPGEAFFTFLINKKEKRVKVNRNTVNIYPKPPSNTIEFTGIDTNSNVIDIEFHNKERNKPNKIYTGQILLNSLLPYDTHHCIELVLDPFNKDNQTSTSNDCKEDVISEKLKYKDGIIPTITLSCYLFQDREKEDEKVLSKDQTPLISAVQKNSLFLVIYCLEHFKASINQKDDLGNTALHTAAIEYNNEHIILTLLNNSHVDVTIKNLDENTPLHFFCSYFRNPNCSEAFNMFLKRGADVNALNRLHETPLHRAIQNPSIRMLLVELLLRNGALVNFQTEGGQTALHWAVYMQRVDLLSILLLYGADINIPNKQGETPLSICENKYKGTAFARTFIYILELIKYLENIGADPISIKLLVKNKMFKWTLAKVSPRILFQMGITENEEQMKLVRNFKLIKDIDPEKAIKEMPSKRTLFEGEIPEKGWIRKKETCEYTGEVRKVEFGTILTAILEENNSNTVVIRTFEGSNTNVKLFNENSKILITLKQCNGLMKYFGVLEEEKALIMEYCDNGSLMDLLQRQTIGWKLVFDLAIQIIDAISFLHKQGILHRILKDSNILIVKKKIDDNNEYDDVYTIKLSNFALFELGIESEKIKKMNGLCAAPEIISNELFSDKSDIYSFGIILWQLVYKCIYNVYSKPFEEYIIQNLKEPQIMNQIVSSNLRPVIPPPTPPRLATLLRLCVLKEPETRPTLNEIESTLVACEKEYNNNSSLWDASIEVKSN